MLSLWKTFVATWPHLRPWTLNCLFPSLFSWSPPSSPTTRLLSPSPTSRTLPCHTICQAQAPVITSYHPLILNPLSVKYPDPRSLKGSSKLCKMDLQDIRGKTVIFILHLKSWQNSSHAKPSPGQFVMSLVVHQTRRVPGPHILKATAHFLLSPQYWATLATMGKFFLSVQRNHLPVPFRFCTWVAQNNAQHYYQLTITWSSGFQHCLFLRDTSARTPWERCSHSPLVRGWVLIRTSSMVTLLGAVHI